MVFFDLVDNLVQTLATHAAFAIGNQNNLPLILEFPAVCTDHLNSDNE